MNLDLIAELLLIALVIFQGIKIDKIDKKLKELKNEN